MHKLFTLAISASVAAQPAFAATTKTSDELANELGSIIAAEIPCGFTYDQAAIRRYINKNVSEEDMGFPSVLSVLTRAQADDIQKMDVSARTAFCTQIERVARYNGFIR